MNTLAKSRLARFRFFLPVGLLAVYAGTCHAHPGHAHEIGGIGWGLAHPFTGLDHLLAALAVGMFAGLWRRPSLAVLFLAAGALGGFAGAKMGAFIGLESVLAVSVLVFGIGLAHHKRVPQSAALTLVAMGAAAHGWAHASEASGMMSITGIFFSTAAIVALGAAAAFAVQRSPRVITRLGAGIATAAIAILAGIL